MSTRDEIIALIRSCATETVDWDFHGNKLTDADVALWGAYGPLMMRVVRAAQRQAYERAADKVFEMAQQSEYALNWVPLHKAQESIRALIDPEPAPPPPGPSI